MKILGVVIGLQTVLIAVLIYKVFALESTIVKATPQQKKIIQEYQHDTDDKNLSVPQSNVDYQKLREIIRDEIAQIEISSSNHIPNIKDKQHSDTYVLENIDNNVLSIVADGKITESELATLERQMANLNKKDRQRVLNMLAKEASNNAIPITPK